MNAIKGVLVGFAAAGMLLTGAQAIAAPAATSASSDASANVTGEVVAVVAGKSIKVKVDASTTVDVDLDAKTIVSGEIKVGVTVNVNGKKVERRILASGVVVVK